MTASLLPIPDDPRWQSLAPVWDNYQALKYPRSAWLHDFEAVLRLYHPHASSRDLAVTARSVAPFPLRDGPNVP
jgi:hypothetical protein